MYAFDSRPPAFGGAKQGGYRMGTTEELIRSALSRRSVIRGGAMGIAGIASAALLGCGSSSSGGSGPAADKSTVADASITGAPIVRLGTK